MSLTGADALGIQRDSLARFIRWMAVASPGAGLLEAPGIVASLVPATPRRSIPNSVVYEDATALDRSLPELDAAYERAGVRAWTVWAPAEDAEAIGILKEAGLSFDGNPAAMMLSLDQLAAPDPGDLDWDSACSAAECGALNDDAYGFQAGEGMAAAVAERALGARLYRARLGGEPACVLGSIDGEKDCGVFLVATARAHQGKRLASRLLGIALLEARGRGMSTSSLQASQAGAPIYERLGYESVFAWQLYERRTSDPGGDPASTG